MPTTPDQIEAEYRRQIGCSPLSRRKFLVRVKHFSTETDDPYYRSFLDVLDCDWLGEGMFASNSTIFDGHESTEQVIALVEQSVDDMVRFINEEPNAN